MREIIIRDANAGGRTDKYLFRYLDKAPKSFVYKMMRKKNIVLNGKKVSGSEILSSGDMIQLYLSEETIQKFRSSDKADLSSAQQIKKDCAEDRTVFLKTEPAENASFPGKNGSYRSVSEFRKLIIFEDDNLIALNKPAGMLSQKAFENDISLNDLLLLYLKKTDSLPEDFTPGISNRLDRNTSGIILCGLNAASSRSLNSAVKDRKLKKIYNTVVKGRIDKQEIIKGWISKDSDDNTARILPHGSFQNAADKVLRDGIIYREIITGVRPLTVSQKASFLEVDLITGRTHQIRAHLASTGHPVAGDTKYGDRQFNRYMKEKYGLKHQLLHAQKIVFEDMPGILEYLNGTEIFAPVPPLFETVLKEENIWLPGEAGV